METITITIPRNEGVRVLKARSDYQNALQALAAAAADPTRGEAAASEALGTYIDELIDLFDFVGVAEQVSEAIEASWSGGV